MDVRTLRALEAGQPPVIRLEDKYSKEGVLGQGSFGTVWRVRQKAPLAAATSGSSRRSSSSQRGHRSTGVPSVFGGSSSSSNTIFVAKELAVAGATANRSRALAELAAREVRVLARLEHPNVVRYIEQISEPQRTYIVMEFCPGGDLKQLLKKRLSDGVFLRERDVLSMYRQLLRAVSYVHSKHLLHRDIKSANIFLTKSGRLKLGDFGLSKEGFGTIDQARTICGTPMYYCPEMVREAPYDAKADVWALGCVFYEIIALKHPFQGVSMRDLPRKILNLEMDDPNPGRRYTAELAATVMRCMLCPATTRLPAQHLLDHPAFQRPEDRPSPPAAPGAESQTGDSTATAEKPKAPPTTPPNDEVTRPIAVPRGRPPAAGVRRPGAAKLAPASPPPPKRPPPSADPTFAGREARLRRLLGEARNRIVANVGDAAERRRQLADCDAVIAVVRQYADDADGAAPEDSTHRFMHAERVVTLLGDACDDQVFADVCVVLGIHGGAGAAARRARSAERDA